MNEAITITAAEKERLAALLASPAAEAASRQAQAVRAADRSAIIAAALAAERAARSEAAKSGAAALRARTVVTERSEALAAAQLELFHLECAASNAGAAAERALSRALWELRELGGGAIERALSSIRIAEAKARQGLSWRETRGWDGRLTNSVPTDPALHDFVARMKALASEIEALRLAG